MVQIPMHKLSYAQDSKRLQMPKIAAFDIETKGLGGEFILGCIWTSDAQRMLFDDLNELFGWIINHPEYRYLAHNASGYEFAYLYPLVYDFFASRNNVRIIPTLQGDTRIVQLRIEITDGEKLTRRGKPAKTTIDLRDTLCLFGMALDKVAKSFCPELPKLKKNIDFEKEDFNPQNTDHLEYLYRDCEIVLRAYERLWNDMITVFGVPLGVTAGSTSLKAFKSTIPDGHVYYRVNKMADEFIRKAYYGGLVLPGHMVGDWGQIGGVDVNGAYAFQMKEHMFPIGSPARTIFYEPNKIGFYQCECFVPDTIFDTLGFNPIPRRDDKGLCWPSGRFETYLSTPEIEYAKEKGCEVKILCGFVFDRTENVFKDFIEKCQDMELFNGGVYKPTIKLIRNSAYGKFGSKEVHKKLVYSKEVLFSDSGFKPLMMPDTGHIIDGVYMGEEIQDADYMLPHWAALITAYERIYIMRVAEEAYRRGARNVYADTDSVKTDLPILLSMVEDGFIPVGTQYGEFKVEEICRKFIVLGGKCYYGEPKEQEKPLVVKAKGIPNRKLTVDVFNQGLETLGREQAKTKGEKEKEKYRDIEFISVKSVMSIIKEKSSVKPIRRTRKVTDMRNSYAWQLTKDGKIYPLGYVIGEIKENDREPTQNQEGVYSCSA